MQFNLTIDEALIKKARTLTGLRSDRELVEFGLRALIRSKGVESQRHSLQDQDDDEVGTNPITALLESDFIACAMLDDTSLSRNYKDELTVRFPDVPLEEPCAVREPVAWEFIQLVGLVRPDLSGPGR